MAPQSLRIRPDEDALVERIRLFLFSANLPVQRLEHDIENIGSFTAPGVRAPHLHLVRAMPLLTPAADAIVRATVRTYGTQLFAGRHASAALRALVKAGPVRFAIAAVLTEPRTGMPADDLRLIETFQQIFARHPEAEFVHARSALAGAGLPTGAPRP